MTTRVPCGVGRTLVGQGRLAVGGAAFGHPLQLGIADTLSTCARAAVALLEAGLDRRPLTRRYVDEGVVDLLEDSLDGARALKWLRRSGDRAAAAFARARKRDGLMTPFAAGVLGLPSPTPRSLLKAARGAGVAEWFGGLFRNPVELPSSGVRLEPDLYYVVDDDPESRELLTDYLEGQGAEVVAFADELALFCAVARRPPTAVLLDVVLNWVDGLRLAEGLKTHPLTRDTQVIVMSGLSRPHVRERALKAGALAFLPKPFDPELLWKVLGRRQPPEAEAARPACRAQRARGRGEEGDRAVRGRDDRGAVASSCSRASFRIPGASLSALLVSVGRVGPESERYGSLRRARGRARGPGSSSCQALPGSMRPNTRRMRRLSTERR